MALTVLGSGDVGGTYVLRIEVKKTIQVCFGRFMYGKPIVIPAGIYAYVGSALGTDKRLGQRIGRHITKSKSGSDPGMRQEIVKNFGKGMFPKGQKKLHWHIDYLLDQTDVRVTDLIAVRSLKRLENDVAELLMAEGQAVAKGLGASDIKGHTHLLKVFQKEAWWDELKVKIEKLANA